LGIGAPHLKQNLSSSFSFVPHFEQYGSFFTLYVMGFDGF
jgi:hypothetical protein